MKAETPRGDAGPAERVAFVLRGVFRCPFAEVAEIVGRTPAACRRLASSARRRIRGAQAPARSADRQTDVVRNFKEAWEAKDIDVDTSHLLVHS